MPATSTSPATRHPTLFRRLRRLLLCSLPMLAFGAAAQDYPNKPVKLIVAYNAGGPMDAGARVLAAGLTKVLGQTFVVENKTGASGRIGTEAVLHAPADGYTLMYAIADQVVINQHVFPNLKYDPLTAFDAVAPLGKMPMVMAARGNLSENNAAGLLKAAKAAPGKFSYGSWGVGSLGHLGGAMLEQIGGIDMLHVAFQGGAPAQQQLLAGEIDMLLVQVPYAIAQTKAGRLKILGLSSPTRNPQWPDIPTVAEQGFPGYSAETWSGVFAPKGTPAAARATLARAIHEVVSQPAVQAQLKDIGFDPMTINTAEFTTFVKGESDRWGKLIRSRNITLQ